MPERKSSTERTAAEIERAGINVERFYGDTIYTGNRDAMVAAGLVAPEQIPGEPTCPNRKMPFCFERDGRPFVVRSSRRNGTVTVRVSPTQEEEQAGRVAADAERNIAGLPESREHYERIVRALTSVRPGRDVLLRSLGGYTVTDAAWNEFEQAVNMACDELLEHVTFSRAARNREIAAWRQKAADADPNFARFLEAAGASHDDSSSMRQPVRRNSLRRIRRADCRRAALSLRRIPAFGV
jgi:hypothetical protein